MVDFFHGSLPEISTIFSNKCMPTQNNFYFIAFRQLSRLQVDKEGMMLILT